MNSSTTTPARRLVAAGLLLMITVAAIVVFSGSWDFLADGSPYNLLFVSASLLLVLGGYVTEPFFTKPLDALVNSVAFVVALVGVREPGKFFAYPVVLVAAVLLVALSVFVVVTPRTFNPTAKRVVYQVITQAGRSVILFALLYLLVLFSFLAERPAEFWVMGTVLVLLVARRPVEAVVNLAFGLFSRPREEQLLGVVSSRLNPRLVLVQRTSSAKAAPGQMVLVQLSTGGSAVGVVLYEMHRAVGVDLTVALLGDSQSLATYSGRYESETDLSTALGSLVRTVDPAEIPKAFGALDSWLGGGAVEDVIGFVAPTSSLESLLVEVPESFPPRLDLTVGSVVSAKVRDSICLYQIVEVLLEEESMPKGDSRGFAVFRAQPLGVYKHLERQLEPASWVPDIYAPVLLSSSESPTSAGNDVIGHLPNTNLPIPLQDRTELVTHNTAILGILGIGKTSLSVELIQKAMIDTDCRVVCIDITNEYEKTLPDYVPFGIQADTIGVFPGIRGAYGTVVKDNPEASGNRRDYVAAIKADLTQFLFGASAIPNPPVITGSDRIRIFNPDYHQVSRGENKFNVFTTELTQAEKTRIIAEQLFILLRDMGPTNAARVLLVLEEAHSLVPEWNAAANDADRAATNGTARVILQGRKYGLGAFVVTQRTAHVSKSILNQCNTIFALRIFDDTGKQFLENYVGRRYATALPTLLERNAVIVGRALRLRQPVIVQLNDIAVAKGHKPKKQVAGLSSGATVSGIGGAANPPDSTEADSTPNPPF